MKKVLFILLFFKLIIGVGQEVQIDTLLINPTQKEWEDFKFPIIRIENEKLAKVINEDLKERFLGNEYSEFPIEKAIIEWADENIVYLDFEITYNKNGILSLNISTEGCGAYCTNWTVYYNYSTITGDFFMPEDIIKISEIKDKINRDKKFQYLRAKQELDELFAEPDSGLDKEQYDWALREYKSCEEAFEIEEIAIYEDYLQIIYDCHLPHAIRSLEPQIELKYNYQDISDYLKIEIN